MNLSTDEYFIDTMQSQQPRERPQFDSKAPSAHFYARPSFDEYNFKSNLFDDNDFDNSLLQVSAFMQEENSMIFPGEIPSHLQRLQAEFLLDPKPTFEEHFFDLDHTFDI
jgi:hypothetical protein